MLTAALELDSLYHWPKQFVESAQISWNERSELGAPRAVRDFDRQCAVGKADSMRAFGDLFAAHYRPGEHGGFFRGPRAQQVSHDSFQVRTYRLHKSRRSRFRPRNLAASHHEHKGADRII